MKLTSIAPELRGRVRWMPPTPIGSRFGLWLTRAGVSRMKSAAPDGVIIRTELAGTTPVRLYFPEYRKSAGALMWVHGGGYLVGSAAMDDRFCGETCHDLGIAVISVDYRLAPEHPFPAASDDCFEAWSWFQRSAASFGVDPRCIAIGGQSAGAGLAAALAHRIRDGGGRQPKAQWLFCPMLDDRTAVRGDLDALRHFIWNNRSNAIGWRSYLGVQPGGAEVPAGAVPARSDDLRGLPPTWIGVGDIDLFFEEDQSYAKRLLEADVDVTFETVAGAPHGFEAWACDLAIAIRYVAKARGWLFQALKHDRSANGGRFV